MITTNDSGNLGSSLCSTQVNEYTLLSQLAPTKGNICFSNANNITIKGFNHIKLHDSNCFNQSKCQCITASHIEMMKNSSCVCNSKALDVSYNTSCRCNNSYFILKRINVSCSVDVETSSTAYTLWDYINFVCMFILLVVGVPGNTLIAITITKMRSMQNLQNYFVFSFSVNRSNNLGADNAFESDQEIPVLAIW